MIKPGTYRAKIIDWGMHVTKNGNPQPFIQFEIFDEDHTEKLRWFGSFSTEKLSKVTNETLQGAGMSKPDFKLLAQGKDGKALTEGLERIVTVVHEEFNGKTMTKIKWVNSPSTDKFERAKENEIDFDKLTADQSKFYLGF